ncbi:MAG TPA: GAF domain-containing protein [Ohtaekwangia sp.]
MKILEAIRRHALIVTAVVLLVLIVVNTTIAIFNHLALNKKDSVTAQTQVAIHETEQVWNQVVRNVDVGMRGYALLKGDSLSSADELASMMRPMSDGIRDLPIIVNNLRKIAKEQNFSHPEAIDSIEIVAAKFIQQTQAMTRLIEQDQRGEFFSALRKDPGRDAWIGYARNADVIKAFENDLHEEATRSYEASNRLNLYFQLAVCAISFVTLSFMIYKINSDRKARRQLFVKLDTNNREFIFDPGNKVEGRINENEVIDSSILTVKQATHFIGEVSDGNFSAEWKGMNAQNEKLNVSNLAGKLIQMRDRMKSIRAQEEVRNWLSEGLAKFSDVIRENQSSIEALSYNVLVYLVKYLKAQQGCLFVVRESTEGGDPYLEMTACYAFERKKFLTKRIEFGEGTIGQVYLEGTSLLLTQVPDGYTAITSGLGEHTATCVLIVPMKANDQVEGIIEIAGFERYQKHQIEFLEKVGEITASTLSSVRNTEKMQHMVNQFKTQAQQLKEQEEELRQNLEEMEATQEAMRRREREE